MMQAIQELESLGYVFTIAGDSLRYRFVGHNRPNSNKVLICLNEIRANKAKAIRYLQDREKSGFLGKVNKLPDNISAGSREVSIAKVTAIKEQAAALGWQEDQLERLTVIIKACPCEIGHICRQSIQLHMVDNDGNFRGSSRFYNMRVNQPWFQHKEEE